jgi:hypothetical protein
VPDFADIRLSDGSVVRVELAPVGHSPSEGDGAEDLPDGFSAPVPVGRGSRAAAAAAGTLRAVLRPLGLVLQEVHDSVSALGDPPQEVSVELGVQIGQDLTLGIVGGNSQASMKVCAVWRPAPTPVPAAAPGAPAASGVEVPVTAAAEPGAR